MLKRLKQSLANRLLKYLYSATTEDDFMRVLRHKTIGSLKGSISMASGEENEQWVVLEEAHVKNMANEALALLQFDVYKKSIASMRNHAKAMIFNKAKNSDDLLFPKALLYNVDILDKKIRAIAELI